MNRRYELTRPPAKALSEIAKDSEVLTTVLGGGKVKSIYTLHAIKRPIREISRTLEFPNTVRKYVRAEELPRPKPCPRRKSKLEPYRVTCETG
jgi:hypothetical protein